MSRSAGRCRGLVKDLKINSSSSVVKVGTKVRNIRIIEGDHDIDCKIDGIGAMQLKSEFVKKGKFFTAFEASLATKDIKTGRNREFTGGRETTTGNEAKREERRDDIGEGLLRRPAA